MAAGVGDDLIESGKYLIDGRSCGHDHGLLGAVAE